METTNKAYYFSTYNPGYQYKIYLGGNCYN